jgi:site-specific DNA-methyltransferase (cytosine-N4-specific)
MSLFYSDDAVTLYHGDAAATLAQLDAGSVDCIVTSPPYFGLRDYGPDGQIGAEPTPDEFVRAVTAVFREARRVLADDGTFWLNLGDTYSAKRPYQVKQSRAKGAERGTAFDTTADRPVKNLLGIPWRVAFALQDDGWILRQEVIWSKRSCMPEAVTDRPSRSHEQVFLFTKRPHYWYDADAIREDSDPQQVAHNQRYAKVYAAQADRAATTGQPGNNNSAGIHSRPGKPGRNARSVWHLSMTPFPSAHFATMPTTLAERCILAGCKPGGTVLDPFSGSGTTGMVATKHGRRYVGIDLNEDYLRLSLDTRLAQGVLDWEAS